MRVRCCGKLLSLPSKMAPCCDGACLSPSRRLRLVTSAVWCEVCLPIAKSILGALRLVNGKGAGRPSLRGGSRY
jgi:hypothetical protein